MKTSFATMVGSNSSAASGLPAQSLRQELAQEIAGLVPGIATQTIGNHTSGAASELSATTPIICTFVG